MASQFVEFPAPSGETYSSVTLYTPGDDNPVQAASIITERTNNIGRYVATFTNVPAGTYQVKGLTDGDTVAGIDYYVDILLADGTYYVYEPTVATVNPQSIRDAMELMSTGGEPSIDDKLDAISATVGPGSIKFELIIDYLGTPIVGAEVWVSTDESGSTVVAGTLLTDDSGYIYFMLDADVEYYLWIDHVDYNYTNPTERFRYSSSNARWESWNGSAWEVWV